MARDRGEVGSAEEHDPLQAHSSKHVLQFGSDSDQLVRHQKDAEPDEREGGSEHDPLKVLLKPVECSGELTEQQSGQ